MITRQKKLLLIPLSAFLVNFSSASFTTLKQLESFIAHNPEKIKSENKNILYPSFHSLYYGQKESPLSQFLRKIGLGSIALWSPTEFIALLERIVALQKKQSADTETKIAYLKVNPGSQLYVWGSLYGNIHSLTKSLTWLHNQKIITNTFKLASENIYFIFLGDMIGRSAYSLQFLTVILTLIENNPNQVFYLQGNIEENGHWEDFDIRKQLQIIFEQKTKEEVPYSNLISRFFENLPIALYINNPSNSHDLIGFYSGNTNLNHLDEYYYGSFFRSTKPLQYLDIDIKDDSPDTTLQLKTIIKNENAITGKQEIDGLTILEQIKGALTFGIISAPVIQDKEYSYFFYDAFIKIDIKESLEKSTLTLYNHSVKEKNAHFNEARTLNIITALNPAKTPKSDIVFGSTMSLEYGIPWHGIYTREGILARVNEVNDAGGINGHLVKAYILNDNYVPFLAREAAKKLIARGIHIFLDPVGTATLKNYLDFVKEKKILVLFPSGGGGIFRKPDLTNIISLRASSYDETKAVMHYMLKNYGVTRFAFFFQNDPFGVSALDAAHDFLKEHGITEWTDISYTLGTRSYKEHAEKLIKAQPEALGLFAVGPPAKAFLEEVGTEYLSGVKLFSITDATDPTFKDFFIKHGNNIIMSCVMPNPKTSSMEIAQDYRKAMDLYNFPYIPFGLEGYIAATLLLDTFKKIGEPITNEKIIKYLESLKNTNIKGFPISFNPETRSLATTVWIATKDDEDWPAISLDEIEKDKNKKVKT